MLELLQRKILLEVELLEKEKKTPLQKEFAQFEAGQTIRDWEANKLASYNSGLVSGLKTAMGIFDMSPEDFFERILSA